VKQGLHPSAFFECLLLPLYPQDLPSRSTDVTIKHPRGTTSVMSVSTVVRSCHCASHARHLVHVYHDNLVVHSIGVHYPLACAQHDVRIPTYLKNLKRGVEDRTPAGSLVARWKLWLSALQRPHSGTSPHLSTDASASCKNPLLVATP
jgi:hypothetical protein